MIVTEPDGLPAYLDPQWVAQTGIEVLEHGLPALPDVLTYEMSIPLTYWKGDECAVVLFLSFRDPGDGVQWPRVCMGTFFREAESWQAHRAWGFKGWSYDPIARPDYLGDLDGEAIGSCGGLSNAEPAPGSPAAAIVGRVAPAVKQIALVQDGREDRRPLESHLGAWVVCIERASPYEVRALDEHGTMLGSIPGDTA